MSFYVNTILISKIDVFMTFPPPLSSDLSNMTHDRPSPNAITVIIDFWITCMVKEVIYFFVFTTNMARVKYPRDVHAHRISPMTIFDLPNKIRENTSCTSDMLRCIEFAELVGRETEKSSENYLAYRGDFQFRRVFSDEQQPPRAILFNCFFFFFTTDNSFSFGKFSTRSYDTVTNYNTTRRTVFNLKSSVREICALLSIRISENFGSAYGNRFNNLNNEINDVVSSTDYSLTSRRRTIIIAVNAFRIAFILLGFSLVNLYVYVYAILSEYEIIGSKKIYTFVFEGFSAVFVIDLTAGNQMADNGPILLVSINLK